MPEGHATHRLYGSFTEAALPVAPPRGQVRIRLIGATHWTDLPGPTACELLTKAETAAMRARRDPTATLFMDQSVLAGVRVG